MEPKSLDELIKNVRELAETYPDAVYQMEDLASSGAGCSYVEGEVGPGEGCIVGQASVGSLVEDEYFDDRCTIDVIIAEYGNLFTDTTDSKKGWLYTVQNEQDNGATWSEAVEKADAEYNIDV